jgi:hypothetical protein
MHQLEKNPLTTKCWTSFTGFFIGDVVAQLLTEPHFTISRTLILAGYGFFIDAPAGNAFYVRYLDTHALSRLISCFVVLAYDQRSLDPLTLHRQWIAPALGPIGSHVSMQHHQYVVLLVPLAATSLSCPLTKSLLCRSCFEVTSVCRLGWTKQYILRNRRVLQQVRKSARCCRSASIHHLAAGAVPLMRQHRA